MRAFVTASMLGACLVACNGSERPHLPVVFDASDASYGGYGGGGYGGYAGSGLAPGTGGFDAGTPPAKPGVNTMPPPPPEAGIIGCFSCGPNCSACNGGPCFCTGATGGTGGTGTGGTGSNPQPLPWAPPFDHTGKDGWKQSSGSLCTGLESPTGLDVWSSDSGVFVVASGNLIFTSPLGLGVEDDAGVLTATDAGTSTSATRTTIWHNDGSGWHQTFDRDDLNAGFRLTGVRKSVLFLNDPTSVQGVVGPMGLMMTPGQTPATSCSLAVVRGAAIECNDLDPVAAVFAIDATLAYAVMGGTRLLVFDGTRWRPSPALIPYPVVALWADAQHVIAVGRSGTMLHLEQDQWKLDDPGTLDHLSAIWASSEADIWIGSEQGHVFHYDGTSWTQVAKLGGVTCSAVSPVRGIWGSGGTVYFHSDQELARWDGSSFESLGNWACSTNGSLGITGLWGNRADEVFMTLVDGQRSGETCGAAFIVYYDGTQFHRF